jgi:hypothetical protein
MPGGTFLPGEVKIEPGVFFRPTVGGIPPLGVVPQGIVGWMGKADRGPLGQIVTLETPQEFLDTYGSAYTTGGAMQVWQSQIDHMLAVRLGSGAATAMWTFTLLDGTTVAINLSAINPGTGPNAMRATIRDSLTDSTKREFLLYDGTLLRQAVAFAKAPTTVGGRGEPGALVAAINASGSKYLGSAALVGTPSDTSTLAAVTTVAPSTQGTDPTITNSDYSAALTLLETGPAFNVLAIDSEDQAVGATAQAWVDRVRSQGRRVIVILGEATSIALATRQADARAYNDPAVIYIGNGFIQADGTTIEGYKAANRLAGMIASMPYTRGLTRQVVTNAVAVKGPLSLTDRRNSITAGMLELTTSPDGSVVTDYGITTFTVPNADMDAGYKKIRRVRTRDIMLDRIGATWFPLVGNVNNDPPGRATLMGQALRVMNQMVAEGGLMAAPAPSIVIDPSNPPAGDSVYFIITAYDQDSAEHIYATVPFSFAPPA